MSRPDEVDEGLIHAWLDGELPADEAARVERLAMTDAAWSAAVAEARGLVAAASRIVRALDAVPGGVVPAASKAAPTRAHRVRPWMRMAAGMLLVAGTAYTVRQAMVPVADVAVDLAPAPAPTGATATRPPDPQLPAPPSTAERRAASGSPGPQQSVLAEPASENAAPQSSSPRATTLPPSAPNPPAPIPRRVDEAREAEADVLGRKADTRQPALTAQRGRAERAAPAPAAPAVTDALRDIAAAGAAAGPLRALEDCWRVTAPDSLAALYRDLTVLRQSGDTLVLVLPSANIVAVVRRGDTLTGALTALRVSCPLGSATTPLDSK